MSIHSVALIQSGMINEMNRMQQVASGTSVSPSLSSLSAAQSSPPVSFDHVIKSALQQVNGLQQISETKQTAVDMGKSDDLTGAMLASQQASLSFSALVQIRNKVATGFNDLMSMSV